MQLLTNPDRRPLLRFQRHNPEAHKMSSKRKTPSLGLERRVRARREEQWEPEPESDVDSEDDSPVEESALNRDGDDVEESDQEPSEEQVWTFLKLQTKKSPLTT